LSADWYIQAGIIGSIAGFLAHSQVDYFWQVAQISGLFWALCGIGISAAFLNKQG